MTLGNLHVKGKSLDSYTLNEFTELAKQSRDNQELEIRAQGWNAFNSMHNS